MTTGSQANKTQLMYASIKRRIGFKKGVYAMKLGNFLLILLIALVSLGFLINDSIHTHADLRVVNQTVASIQEENAQLNQTIAEQTKEIQALKTQNSILEEQNEILSAHNSELSKQHNTLVTNLNNLQIENNALRNTANQLASDTNSPLVKAIAILSHLVGTPTNDFMAAVTLLPIFLAGGSILVHKLFSDAQRKNQPNNFNIKVSKSELEAIIRRRRAR